MFWTINHSHILSVGLAGLRRALPRLSTLYSEQCIATTLKPTLAASCGESCLDGKCMLFYAAINKWLKVWKMDWRGEKWRTICYNPRHKQALPPRSRFNWLAFWCLFCTLCEMPFPVRIVPFQHCLNGQLCVSFVCVPLKCVVFIRGLSFSFQVVNILPIELKRKINQWIIALT